MKTTEMETPAATITRADAMFFIRKLYQFLGMIEGGPRRNLSACLDRFGAMVELSGPSYPGTRANELSGFSIGGGILV